MSTDELAEILHTNPAVLVYATTTDCGVCTSLRPKREALQRDHFPRLLLLPIHLDQSPDVSSDLMINAVPTVLCFFDGKEHLRKVRVFGIEELREAIQRPYDLMF